ncbi:MAG: alanine--tRNA ligase [Longimicrobiales bacterium]
MTTAEIRASFLRFFQDRGHEVRPSSALVPAEDPTLLFTNAGMVQFKRVFLGSEDVPYRRAVTSQKCVRAGGKHNDLEEVGRTARHHTFFEMLGNFSFGDYFKRDAIEFAWEFLIDELGLDPNRMYVTVHHTDDEAAALWEEVARVAPERIYRLGDEDNFWQMADTGPCGPCSEVHYDVRPEEKWGEVLSVEEFEAAGEAGEFLELWNLVFMQFDRDEEGNDKALPAPSIDTGAGLERLAAAVQGVDSNYDIDVFRPLLDAVAEAVDRPYEPENDESVSYRVLADHARAVAFLLTDGVFPSNEGRGYVLRRILRRAVRHAWLLGRREPTLVNVVESVIDTMGDVFRELRDRREHILTTVRAEEERFLDTVEGGMARFDELVPEAGDPGGSRVVPGEEVFKLYDTFGFPPDLTTLMAEERGYGVDLEGFERALHTQRDRSRADRKSRQHRVSGGDGLEGWKVLDAGEQTFVGYEALTAETTVLGLWNEGDRLGVHLRENPFYIEAGGQVSDVGTVSGDCWSIVVDEVRRVGDLVAVFGVIDGEAPSATEDSKLSVSAVVDRGVRRDTQRNHTATHLLHAALRDTLGKHVVQRGSLVAPDRLRFDFAHTSPMTPDEIREVEGKVNAGIFGNHDVVIESRSHEEAVADGAMALFGEKYGDVVRVVRIPGVSMELCGGTHVANTSEIGLFRLTQETGIGSGVRRVEALTGPGVLAYFEGREALLEEVANELGATSEGVVARVRQLIAEKQELEGLLNDLRSSGGGGETVVREAVVELNGGGQALYRAVRIRARDPGDVRKWGDSFLGSVGSGVAVVAADLPGGKHSLFAFVTDDLIGQGIRADVLVRAVAAVVGGRGGGKAHMAQGGVENPEAIVEALEAGEAAVRDLASEGTA